MINNKLNRLITIILIIITFSFVVLPTNMLYAAYEDYTTEELLQYILDDVCIYDKGYGKAISTEVQNGLIIIPRDHPIFDSERITLEEDKPAIIIDGIEYYIGADGMAEANRSNYEQDYRGIKNDEYKTSDYFIIDTLSSDALFYEDKLNVEVYEGSPNGEIVAAKTIDLKVESNQIDEEGTDGEIDITDKIDEDKNYWFTVEKSGTYKVTLNGQEVDVYTAGGNKLSDAYENAGDGIKQGNKNALYKELKQGNQYYIKVSDVENANLSIEYAHDKLYNDQNPYSQYETETNEGQATLFERVISWFLKIIGDGILRIIGWAAGEDITIDALIFNKYTNTKLAFFKDLGETNQFIEDAGIPDLLNNYFRLFRNIALMVYVLILLYMGIRILMNSTAGERAKYKELMKYWVQGIAILFFFPYVIKYTILLNNGIVKYIDTVKPNYNMPAIKAEGSMEEDYNYGADGNNSSGTDYMSEMRKILDEKRWLTYAICWLVMIYQLVGFLITYFKRLLMTLFLIAIFPFVTISYALDKIGDAKSQAFNNWFKEFFLNVFMQTFHAVNYVIIMGIVFNLEKSNWFLIIIGITYITKGEAILRGIFSQMKGGGGETAPGVAKSMIRATAVTGMVKDVGKSVKNTFGAGSHFSNAKYAFNEWRHTKSEMSLERVRPEYNAIQESNMLNSLPPNIFETQDESENNIAGSIETALNQDSSKEQLLLAINNLREYANSDNMAIREALNNQLASLSEEQYKEILELMDIAQAMNAIEIGDKASPITLNQSVDLVIKGRRKGGSAERLAENLYLNNTQLNNMKSKNEVMNSVAKKKKTKISTLKRGTTAAATQKKRQMIDSAQIIPDSAKDKKKTGSTGATTSPEYKSNYVGENSDKKRQIIKESRKRMERFEAKYGITEKGQEESATTSKNVGNIQPPNPVLKKLPVDMIGEGVSEYREENNSGKKRKIEKEVERVRRKKVQNSVNNQKQELFRSVTGTTSVIDAKKEIGLDKLDAQVSYDRLGEAVISINNANNGEFSYREMGNHIDIYKKEMSREYKYTKEIAQGLKYKIDEFETNWAAEVLLNAKDVEGTDAERQATIDKAIDVIINNKDREEGNYKAIIEKLEKEISLSDLKKGHMPVRKPREDTESIQEENEYIREIMSTPIQQEYDYEYAKLRAAQARYEFVKESSRGVLGLLGHVTFGLMLGGAGAATAKDGDRTTNILGGYYAGTTIGEKVGNIPVGATDRMHRSTERRIQKQIAEKEAAARADQHGQKLQMAENVGYEIRARREQNEMMQRRLDIEKLRSNSTVTVVDRNGKYVIKRTDKDAFGNDAIQKK